MSIITNKIEEAKKAIEELKRNRKFKKANLARAEAAELQNQLAVCRGKLEICKNDFNRTIRHEAKSIAEGVQMGADTVIQEQTMWDAAIGYMMVRDAIYSLKTISTFDSVNYAYDMLGTAVDLMADRKHSAPKLSKIMNRRGRNVYGYITSNAALQQKQEILDSFFEDLKRTGNIEECLALARNPVDIAAARKSGDLGEHDNTLWDSVLGSDAKEAIDDIPAEDIDSMMDIHRPE
jgi:hypothetical protein